jgi:tetratricopeptide (TPR) repeat protein
MHKNNPTQQKIPLRHKTILTICGIFFCVILIEIGLRMGGFIFLSLQEHRNRISAYKKGAYRIMCLGESTTATGGEGAYSYQLEKILNESNIGIKFRVINKGIVCASSSYILAQLEDNLDRYKPEMVTAMIGINDSHIKYYEDIPDINNILFNRFRTYRFLRIAWMHILNKAREKGIREPEENKNGVKLQLSPFNSGSNGRYAKHIDSTQSEKLLKRPIELNPINDKALFELGWLYTDKGEFAQAEDIFKKIIELNPENDKAYFELGRCYEQRGGNNTAVEMYKKAIELNPENDKAYFELGLNNEHLKKYETAVEMYKKAIELDPKHDRAYWGLASCYKHLGESNTAIEIFKKSIEMDPKNVGGYRGLALLFEEMGKYDAAGEYLRKADKLESEYNNPLTRYNYQEIKKILDKRGIKLVCVQYPMRSIEPLRRMFETGESITFVDNEKIFKEALKTARRSEYFFDNFGGDFGHCTHKGNMLLAKNIANVILKECFGK